MENPRNELQPLENLQNFSVKSLEDLLSVENVGKLTKQPPAAQPMILDKQRFVGSRRNTYCDAESIILTTRMHLSARDLMAPFDTVACGYDFRNGEYVVKGGKAKKKRQEDRSKLILDNLKGKGLRPKTAIETRTNNSPSPTHPPPRHPPMLKKQLNDELLREKKKFFHQLTTRRKYRFQLEQNASITLQKAARCSLARKRIAHLKTAPGSEIQEQSLRVMDQQIRRLRDSLRFQKQTELRQEEACIKIQSRFRAFSTRRRIHQDQPRPARHRAQVALAKLVRRRLARRFAGLLRMRAQEHQVNRYVVLIQVIARSFLARRRLAFVARALRTTAASMIQRTTRAFLSRRRQSRARWTLRASAADWAATLVQSQARAFLARTRVHRRRRHRFCRLRTACALFLQRHIRGFLARRVVQLVRAVRRQSDRTAAALRLQCFARGLLAAALRRRRERECRSDAHFQARLGDHAAVRRLLETLKWRCHRGRVDRLGDTVLLTAARWGHDGLVRSCLHEWGMDSQHCNFRGLKAIDLAAENAHDMVVHQLVLADAGLVGVGLMHRVVAGGCKASFRELLTRGVLVGAREPGTGRTPLHAAAGSQLAVAEAKRTEMLELLVHNGADLEAVDDEGNTALHVACQTGSVAAATALLEMGASTEATNHLKEIPWATCLRFGHLECAAIFSQGEQKK